jgi:ElaB/YqjD/DUF883 family membrane-anchored ribosome-binding protein
MTVENFNKLNSSSITKPEDHLSKIAGNAGQKIGKVASDIATAATSRIQLGRDYIVENPAKGVAIAAATGVVVGSLLTMAMRRNRQ